MSRLNKYIILCIVFFITVNCLCAQRVSRRTPVVEVVEKVGPAIVNISTERLIKRAIAPHFDDFFDDFFEMYRHKTFKTRSLGSGVIVDRHGFIVTNAHVVKRASKITVILADGRQIAAQLLAADEKNDLALLKISSRTPLPSVKWGNSWDILIGETAIALGNPFGLKNSVTTGVVSAVDRSLAVQGKVHFRDFLQTDAAINPGNSGGALLNIHGELIGINTAIYAKGQGLGFAIPVNRVRHVLGRLIDYRKTKKLWLGLELREVENSKRWLVQVEDVALSSPAKRAGLKNGDIIQSLKGEQINCLFDFKKQIYLHQAGDILSLKVFSSGKVKSYKIKIKSQPVKSRYQLIWTRLGFLPAQARGLIFVRSVRRNSSAARIGVQAGDAIIALGGYRVKTIEEFMFIIKRLEQGEIVPIVLYRKGRQLGGNLMIE